MTFKIVSNALFYSVFFLWQSCNIWVIRDVCDQDLRWQEWHSRTHLSPMIREGMLEGVLFLSEFNYIVSTANFLHTTTTSTCLSVTKIHEVMVMLTRGHFTGLVFKCSLRETYGTEWCHWGSWIRTLVVAQVRLQGHYILSK